MQRTPHTTRLPRTGTRQSRHQVVEGGGRHRRPLRYGPITSAVGSKGHLRCDRAGPGGRSWRLQPDSRYTRIELIDEGGGSRDSYKQIYSDEATTVALRPTLKITYGTATSGSTSGIHFRLVVVLDGQRNDAARAAVEHPSRRLRHRRHVRHEPPRDLDRADAARRRHVERDREVHVVGQPESARGLQEPAAGEDRQDLVLRLRAGIRRVELERQGQPDPVDRPVSSRSTATSWSTTPIAASPKPSSTGAAGRSR